MRIDTGKLNRLPDPMAVTTVLTALLGVASYFFGQRSAIELNWLWMAFGSICIVALTLFQFQRARRVQALEAQLNAIIDAVPHGLFFKDSKSRYRILNAEFGRMFGLDTEAALGKGDADLFGDALNERFASQDNDLIVSGEACTFDEQIPVGEMVVEVQSRKRPVYDRRTGKLCGIVGVVIDVGDQRRLLRQLEDAHERLRVALDAAELGTWDWNLATNKIHLDSRASQILGIDADSNDLEAVFARLHPDDIMQMRQTLHSTRSSHAPQTYQFRIVDSEANVRWIEGHSSAARTRGGQDVVIGVSRDITERHRLEAEQIMAKSKADQARAEIEQLQIDLEFALSMGGVGVWRSVTRMAEGAPPSYEALRNTVLNSDRKSRAIYGFGAQDVITYSDQVPLLHPDDRERVADNFRRTFERGPGPYSDQYRICRADGSIRTVEVRGALRKIRELGSGAPAISLTGFSKDITEEEQLKAELRAMAHEARQAADAKSQFLATMSHEVRTPLTGILGMIELVLKTPLSAAQRSMLARSQESSTALLAIVNDILDFSKISAGMLYVESRPVSLAGLVEDVCASLAPEAAKKTIGLDFTVDAALPTYVAGDPVRLRQVLMNLVGNAIKFTKRGGVNVSAQCDQEDGVRLLVEDSGIGIDPRSIEALYEPFRQADVATTRHYGGTGLGLTIVKQLVDLMGGRIECDSEPGRGTRFIVRLPLREWSAGQENLPSTAHYSSVGVGSKASEIRDAAQTQIGRGRKILLAEDHRVNREVITLQLAQLGFECDSAEDGEQAWDMLQSPTAHYALLLTDCHMPRLDGYQLTERLRTHEAALGLQRMPIVALTANVLEGEAKRCLEVGMDAYLCKPIRIEALSQELASVLGRADEISVFRSPSDNPYGNLMDLCGGSRKEVARLLQFFLTTTNDDISALNRAEEVGQYRRVRELAHRMGSACKQVGEDKAASAFQVLEHHLNATCDTPDPVTPSLIRRARVTLTVALETARAFVRQNS